jgi:K+:H+ antiporter subunit KhtT
MPEVRETRLPGVGVRHEFETAGGERVAVLTKHSGSREIAVYDRDDPDSSSTILHLSVADTRTLAELLGASQVSETVTSVQQQLEGLAIEWLTLAPSSRFVGASIADGEFRTRTGTSIVAIIRDGATIPAPGPDQQLSAGDVLVVVGTPDGLAQVRSLLGS